MKTALLKTLYRLASLLPNAWAQRLGGVIGNLLYRVDSREKHVALTNIALCFPTLSAQKQQQLVRETLKENAKTLLELPRIFQKGGQFAIDLITAVEGISHYHAAIQRGKGVILLAPHLGNWELTVHYLNQFANITAMYDPPKQVFLDALIKSARQSTGATLVTADAKGVRAQLRVLKNGGVVGILPDQVPRHSSAGVYAPFMGRSAFTMTLIHSLLNRSQAVVLITFAERLPVGGGYRLRVMPVPEAIASDDAVQSATCLNQCIERCVNLAPAQYQWTYKRFKRQADNKNPYQR